ncbi:UNVERIFIED_CONTAM: hypothetical protein NCL1_24652 [Trichonephila clavipes]
MYLTHQKRKKENCKEQEKGMSKNSLTRGHGTTPLRMKEDIEHVSSELDKVAKLKVALLG